MSTENRKLGERVSSLESSIDTAQRAATSQVTEAAITLDAKVQELSRSKNQLRAARSNLVEAEGQQLELAASHRSTQVENLKLQQQVECLEAKNAQLNSRMEQCHALLTDIFKPTDKLLETLNIIREQKHKLQKSFEESCNAVNATEAEKAKALAQIEDQRNMHNQEVQRLKDSYEVIERNAMIMHIWFFATH